MFLAKIVNSMDLMRFMLKTIKKRILRDKPKLTWVCLVLSNPLFAQFSLIFPQGYAKLSTFNSLW